VVTRTFSTPGQATVTLTAKDEYGATATAQKVLSITEPAGNLAPVAVNNPPSCVGLTCNFSAVGTTDPNAGDLIRYRWTFGDGTTFTSTATSPSRVFAAPGTYVATVRATDGWGKFSEASRTVTVSAP
jgi:PKD repeat protein